MSAFKVSPWTICFVTLCFLIPTGNGPVDVYRSPFSRFVKDFRKGCFDLAKHRKYCKSITATHQIGPGRGRTFNAEFLSLLEYYGMSPRTINIRCPNENGTIESLNGHLKRRLKQGLILRGSCDFSSEDSYDQFVHDILDRANSARSQKTDKELTFMKSLPPTRLSEYDELYCRVQSNSIIRVKKRPIRFRLV